MLPHILESTLVTADRTFVLLRLLPPDNVASNEFTDKNIDESVASKNSHVEQLTKGCKLHV